AASLWSYVKILFVCSALAAPWYPIPQKGYTNASSQNDANSGVGPDGMLFATANANSKAQAFGLNGEGVNFALSNSKAGANVFKG
ncbi:unnamed protein product, partial [Allacma fusca]